MKNINIRNNFLSFSSKQKMRLGADHFVPGGGGGGREGLPAITKQIWAKEKSKKNVRVCWTKREKDTEQGEQQFLPNKTLKNKIRAKNNCQTLLPSEIKWSTLTRDNSVASNAKLIVTVALLTRDRFYFFLPVIRV